MDNYRRRYIILLLYFEPIVQYLPIRYSFRSKRYVFEVCLQNAFQSPFSLRFRNSSTTLSEALLLIIFPSSLASRPVSRSPQISNAKALVQSEPSKQLNLDGAEASVFTRKAHTLPKNMLQSVSTPFLLPSSFARQTFAPTHEPIRPKQCHRKNDYGN